LPAAAAAAARNYLGHAKIHVKEIETLSK